MAPAAPVQTDSLPVPPGRDAASVNAREGDAWYTDAATYWSNVPATVEGMLGGFGSLTEADCRGSLNFIQEFTTGESPRIGKSLACDCGAGIGRVSKHFLLHSFDRVDLVEQNGVFLEQAKKDFEKDGLASRVERYIPLGLQSFTPEENRYDLIWIQWVLSHLSDEDVISFLKRCKVSLGSKGLIGIKENVTKAGADVDREDSSVTRSDEILRELYEKAGMRIVKAEKQTGFPKGLYTVYMYLLE